MQTPFPTASTATATHTNGNTDPGPALAPTLEHTSAAQTKLVALTGLMEMYSRRPRLEPSPTAIEYLLESRDAILASIDAAITTYAHASGLASADLRALRAALEIN